MAQRNCRGDVVIVTCPTVCEETPEISLQNVNLSGIGVLDGFVNPNGNFRGVVAGNSMVTVTLDNVNHTIVITPQAAAIAAALPAATIAQVGVLETATDAESLAKSATDKIVTPSNFAAMGATTSFAGLIEIATLAEVQAGTATNLAVVPDTLGDMVFLSLANAATNISGGPVSVDLTNGNLTFSSPGGFTGITLDQATLDFTNNGLITFSGLLVQDAVIGTDSVGVATSYDLTQFISTHNTQTGFGTASGTKAGTNWTTFDPITISDPPTQLEVQAINVALSIVSQRFGAFWDAIKLVKLPAT
jgi:hypothetical protein